MDPLHLVLAEEELLATSPRTHEIERREDPAVGQLAGEVDLHVPRALELLEDDLVHPRASVDEHGAHDGEGAALFDLPRRAEERARHLKRPAVDAPRHGATAGDQLV